MKKSIRIIIDILMFLCILALTGYHITKNLVHEILGTALCILFIVHNVLNFKWYLTLFKGKHDIKRNIHILINIALLIAIILTIVSGVLMSNSIYSFINVNGKAVYRKIHLVANAWTLILVSIHLGFHLNPIKEYLKNRVNTNIFRYVSYIIFVIIFVLAVIFFISEGLFNDMFGITEFKAFNYDENIIVFYIKILIITITIAIFTNILMNFFNKQLKK